MKNWSIENKSKFVSLIASVAVLILGATNLLTQHLSNKNYIKQMKISMQEQTDFAMKEQLGQVISVYDSLYMKYENGLDLLDNVKNISGAYLSAIQFGENGYYTIYTYDGTLRMSGNKQNNEDNVATYIKETTMDGETKLVKVDQKTIDHTIVVEGIHEGGGFINLVKEDGNLTTEYRVYCMSYPNFEWIVAIYYPMNDFYESVDHCINEAEVTKKLRRP